MIFLRGKRKPYSRLEVSLEFDGLSLEAYDENDNESPSLFPHSA